MKALVSVIVVCSLWWSPVTPAQSQTDRPSEVFATVGDTTITADEYALALRDATRRRYYHGAPPAGELARFQREVADDLVNRVLLLKEAARRGIEPDADRVNAEADRIKEGMRRRGQQVDHMVEAIRSRLAEDDMLRQLEQAVRAVGDAEDGALRAYYREHLDKFTEPPQARVSVILLQVDPSSTGEVWQAARAEAAELVRQLRAGADFAEMARLRSADRSAANGGDMGYLHAGMLAPQAEAVIDALAPGTVSDPVQVLEGVAIFRLADRRPARVNEFESVRERVREFEHKDRAERAWQDLIASLRADTRIEINQRLLGPQEPAAKHAGRPSA